MTLAIRRHLEAPNLRGSLSLLGRAFSVVAEGEEYRLYKATQSLSYVARSRAIRKMEEARG